MQLWPAHGIQLCDGLFTVFGQLPVCPEPWCAWVKQTDIYHMAVVLALLSGNSAIYSGNSGNSAILNTHLPGGPGSGTADSSSTAAHDGAEVR